jgi:uncharacterized protein YjbI with pentapeptide repeats
MSDYAFGFSSEKVTPDPTACEAMLQAAGLMLQKAWDNPQALGEASAICGEANELHRAIRSFSTPAATNADVRQVYLDALKLSWLAVWRARDYSIEGTRRRARDRKWPHDYVLEDRLSNKTGHEYGGVRWLHIHYPAFGRDGRPTPAIPRKALSSIANDTPEITEGASVLDASHLENRRAALNWTCVLASLPDVEGGWTLENAWVESEVNLRSIRSTYGPALNSATFLKSVTIQDCKTTNLNALAEARFEEGIVFLASQFSADVAIPDSVEFGPHLRFQSSVFKGGILISKPKGLRQLALTSTEVVGVLSFVEIRTGLALRVSKKLGGISAPGVTFFEFLGSGVEVEKVFDLTRCEFAGRVDLSSATVRCNAQFTRSRFVGIGAPNVAMFHRTQFEGGADFTLAEFGPDPGKISATSLNAAIFSGASFGSLASFQAAKFRCDAHFENADFRDLNCASIAEEKTEFHGAANFKGGAETESGIRNVTVHSAKFDDAVFQGEVNFRNREFQDDTSFDGATFKRAPSFHGSEFHPKTSFTGARFEWRSGLRLAPWKRIAVSRFPFQSQNALQSLRLDNRYLAGVSDSFRVLTTLAKEIESSELAFAFHREEQRSKHDRSAGSDVPRSEAFFGAMYGLFSDYGGSLSRPLLWSTAICLGFALLYAALLGDSPIECMLWESGCQISAAVAIAAERTFLPITSLSGPLAEDWNGVAAAHPFLASALNLIHRLLGTALIFLLALALKRRFQLS